MKKLGINPDVSKAPKPRKVSRALEEAIKFSLAMQVLIVLLAGFLADGGALGQICFFASVGFDSYLVSVLLLRPMSPTKLDLVLIRAGFLPAIGITFFLADYIWDLRGL